MTLRPVASRRFRAAACWAAAGMAVGCNPSPVRVVTPPAPSYAELAIVHNARVEHLQRTHSYGVLELRWEDEQGVHAEPQVDVELWLDLPDRTAVRVDKLGEDFFWIGSDERRMWAFNLINKDDRVVTIRDRDDPETRGDFSIFGLEPASLLDLMALRSLPVELDPTPIVEYDEQRQAWRVERPEGDGHTALYFEPATMRVLRVELLDEERRLQVYSVLSHYESVSRAGVSVLAFSKSPMWIDVYDEIRKGFTKIHLNEMTAEVEAREFESVFDLDRLLQHLNPDRVDRGRRAATGGGDP